MPEGVPTGKKTVAGILLGFMKAEDEVLKGADVALENGAQGICWFVCPIPKSERRNAVMNALALT